VGQETDALKHHIEETRTQLGADLDELEGRVRRAADWRAQFKRHAAALLAAAFGGGLLLSFLTGRSHTR
jgi:hypothetical protein